MGYSLWIPPEPLEPGSARMVQLWYALVEWHTKKLCRTSLPQLQDPWRALMSIRKFRLKKNPFRGSSQL